MKTRFHSQCGTQRASQRAIFFVGQALLVVLAMILLAGAIFPVAAMPGPDAMTAAALDPVKSGEPGTPHISVERSGKFETKNGLTLRLTADLGSVRIITLETGGAPIVRYTMHVETDGRGPQAQSLLEKYVLRAKATGAGVEIDGALPPQKARGAASSAQFWVQFEVAVPPGYSVEVQTGAGDIDTQDIGGTAMLTTQGGNIRTGRIGVSGIQNVAHNMSRGMAHELGGKNRMHASSKLRTEGGHIQVQDVAGDLSAFTGGGHITVGNIAGDATLRSGGGHVRAGKIDGRADLDTDGGNITVGQAGNLVNVRTGGGQIDFGEVHGSVRAQTGGGGIRIMYVAGPMEVESSGGSICLTRVAGAVQAATADGTITAWINPDMGPDVVADAGSAMTAVRVATVQLAGASQLASGNGDIVVFLPRNLAANIDALITRGGEQRIEADPALHLIIQAEQLNGVGAVRATGTLNGGGIPLKLRTTSGKIRLQYLDSEPSLRESRIREQVERLRIVQVAQPATPVAAATPPTPPASPTGPQGDWLESWIDRMEVAVTGGLREDADDFRNRLTVSPHPAYPELAQRVGIQGAVKLQVRVLKDGHVEVLKLLQGEPVLADAAIAAVKQWRGKPAWINGKQVEVISTVTFNFQLR
jgi:TonB family protein